MFFNRSALIVVFLVISSFLSGNVASDDSLEQATPLLDGNLVEEYVCNGDNCDVTYDEYDWYWFLAYEGDEITLEIWNEGYPDMAYLTVQAWDGNGVEQYRGEDGEPSELWIGDNDVYSEAWNMTYSTTYFIRLSTVDGAGGDGTYYQISVDYDTTSRNTDGDSYIDSDDDCYDVIGTSSANLQGCLDSDGDTWADSEDACPNDVSQYLDTDQDGVCDGYDWNPVDPTQSEDSDGDGYGDNASGNQGDHFSNDSTQWYDNDNDGFGDNADGHNPDACRFIYGNSTNDRFGCPDGDGDGWSDGDESWTAEHGADAFPNDADETMDSDMDGLGDNTDVFPNDANETSDSDGDGVGDNGDDFPNDANETMDSDMDGLGDNADAFPNDANETADSDGDGVGNNGDDFPNDADETIDSDMDGLGDNADAFPNDANETADSDGDGVGDNADYFPNDASSSRKPSSSSDEGGLPGFTFALTLTAVIGAISIAGRRKA